MLRSGVAGLPTSQITGIQRAGGNSNNFIYSFTILLKSWTLFLNFIVKVVGLYLHIFLCEAHSTSLKYLSVCQIQLKLVNVFQSSLGGTEVDRHIEIALLFPQKSAQKEELKLHSLFFLLFQNKWSIYQKCLSRQQPSLYQKCDPWGKE